MLLLICSIVMVLLSAFFIANVLDFKNPLNNLIYFLLAAFSNIVLTFEILSLLTAINQTNVIILNVLFVIISFGIWAVRDCPIVKIDFKCSFKKLLSVFKLDKTLALLTVCILFAAVVSLIPTTFLPTIDIDSSTYHVVRSLFWIDNGTLNHFPAAESRLIMFPVNSEILYTWFLLFLRKDILLGVFNFCGVILYFAGLYGVMSFITKSLRKRLWVVLVSLSFPFALVRFSGVETGLIISALTLVAICLYMRFINNKDICAGVMGALAISLAIGTKTSVFFMLPGLFIWSVWYARYVSKKDFCKPVIQFYLFAAMTFLVFASYNYILNFINYGHFFAAENVARGHSNTDGILSVPSNLFRYVFDFFMFPEFTWSAALSTKLMGIRDSVLTFLNANTGFGNTSVVYKSVSQTISSVNASFGFFGILLVIPMFFCSVYKFCVSKTRKNILLFSFTLLFLVSTLLMAYKLAFMSFNIRFLVTFAMVAVPIIYYSYNKRYSFYKLLITIIACFYFIYIPLHISLYPIERITKWAVQGTSVEKLREVCECSFFNKEFSPEHYKIRDIACFLKKRIGQFDRRNRILFFAPSGESLMPVKGMMFEGYLIDIDIASNIKNIDFDNYNIIITCNNEQDFYILDRIRDVNSDGYFFEEDMLCNYLDAKSKIIKDTSEVYPDKAICYFNNEFYKNHNLRQVKMYGYQLGEEEAGDKMEFKYYRFFENLNRPIIE